MKKIMLLGLYAIVLMMSAQTAQAQETPRVDDRQQIQRSRMHEGVASGEVTRAEARRLRAEQRHIRRAERRVKADGEVTPTERARLNRKQNKASRDIRRQKRDAQDRE